MNRKLSNFINIGLSLIILADLTILIFTLVFDLSKLYITVVIFDTVISIILLSEFISRLRKESDRRQFFIKNWSELIAAIPFDLIMFPFVLYSPGFMATLKVLRFIKIIALVLQFFETIDVFLKKTHLDEILGITLLIVIASTLGLYLFDPSMNSLFDSLWFVISTITTVGYGDVMPNSGIGRVIALIILIIGVLIFSTITGAMASYFTRKVIFAEDFNITENDDNIKLLKEDLSFNKANLNRANDKIDSIDSDVETLKNELADIKEELKESRELNRELSEELRILNENLKNK
ncbi:MAG: ion transporter [Methanobrevibacter sp.]|nr:ion transporter [Methanobrevibacter sp.]